MEEVAGCFVDSSLLSFCESCLVCMEDGTQPGGSMVLEKSLCTLNTK